MKQKMVLQINVNDKTYCFESKESMLKFISEYYLSDAEKKELERLRGIANMQHTGLLFPVPVV